MLSNTKVIAAVALLLDDEETEDNVRQRSVGASLDGKKRNR